MRHSLAQIVTRKIKLMHASGLDHGQAAIERARAEGSSRHFKIRRDAAPIGFNLEVRIRKQRCGFTRERNLIAVTVLDARVKERHDSKRITRKQ